MGSPPQSAEAPPAQRNFQRKFALRRVGSARFVVPLTSNHSKLRRHTRQEQSQYRAAPGCQRDRGPSVSGRVQRNPFQGVPLGNFFLTVDAVLLCAAKKNGVETTRLAGYCQSTPGPRTTCPAKKPPAAGWQHTKKYAKTAKALLLQIYPPRAILRLKSQYRRFLPLWQFY